MERDMKPIVDLMDESQKKLKSISFSYELDYEQHIIIAVAIGHHFWNCNTDREAEEMARDCMNDIRKALG